MVRFLLPPDGSRLHGRTPHSPPRHSPSHPSKGPTMPTDTTIETKSAQPDDLGSAFDGFMRAFESFKDANDERLGQLERRMTADVVTTDKVDRLDRALDAH